MINIDPAFGYNLISEIDIFVPITLRSSSASERVIIDAQNIGKNVDIFANGLVRLEGISFLNGAGDNGASVSLGGLVPRLKLRTATSVQAQAVAVLALV